MSSRHGPTCARCIDWALALHLPGGAPPPEPSREAPPARPAGPPSFLATIGLSANNGAERTPCEIREPAFSYSWVRAVQASNI
eukprot:10017581-Alexandrium_andersonii.AAC.1